MATTTGVTFFPDIRYKGMQVSPMWWKKDSTEPLLMCMAGLTGRENSRRECLELMEELRADGWQIARDETKGYVHVDNLEKIQGPPPQGSF